MAFGDTLKQTVPRAKQGFGGILGQPETALSTTGGFGSALSGTDLTTSEGLYQTAVNSGLQEKADRVLSTKGEEAKRIFSGGFISDVFDALNALQYGIVGTLKGKSFKEGVKTRQSFSDQDALGDLGLPGVIGGIALDIAVDPLTYIAPWTVLKKVGAGKKIVQAAQAAQKTQVGKYFGNKFVYRFGQDPVYKELAERSIKNIGTGTQNLVDMVQKVAKIEPKTATKLLTRDKTGRFIRTPLEQLKGVLSKDELFDVSKSYAVLDDLGKQAVDLKLLSKGKWEENLGEYIKNAYTEYETVTKKGLFGIIKKGIKGIKARKPGLTPEKMAELGQIENPAYLLFKSSFDLFKDIENAKLFNAIAKRWGKEVAQEGFKQLPVSARLITTTGKRAEILGQIKQVNTDLKPVFKNLEKTFKADKETLTLIKSIEKGISNLSKTQTDEFYKFFQEGQKITKEMAERGIKTGVPLAERLPRDLFDIAQQIKKGESYDSFKLEKLFRDGVLERNGFESIKNFVDYAKKPAAIIPAKIGTTIAKGNVQKIINLQKQIEKLSTKTTGLREIDKRSIDDAYRFLEDTADKMLTKKGELVEELGGLKLGELAGKWVPENIFDDIQDITRPMTETFGKKAVAGFKFAKVIMNPATHARNIVSNKILNYWKLGMNPLDPRTVKAEATAIKELAKKGGKFTDEAKTVGYNLNTFAANELRGLIESPAAMAFGKKIPNWKNITTKLGNIYQGEENYAKLAGFIFNRNKGLGIEDAWKAAESATFNYAQVTPFIRKVRESLFGFPFITFAYKAAPVAVETAAKYPRRISAIGKIKNAIENQSDIKTTEAERAAEPQWVRDGFYIKLPIKDKQGRSSYFDLSYIIPFGDLISGQFFTRQVSRETGLPESIPETIGEKAPLFNFIKEISKNQDFYGNRIWKEGDNVDGQLKDLFRHLTKTYLPPLIADQIPGGYDYKGEQRMGAVARALTPAEQENQRRTLMQEMLRNVGLKIQPVSQDLQETYMEWEKKKALETLLQEAGVTKTFEKTYIPK